MHTSWSRDLCCMVAHSITSGATINEIHVAAQKDSTLLRTHCLLVFFFLVNYTLSGF